MGADCKSASITYVGSNPKFLTLSNNRELEFSFKASTFMKVYYENMKNSDEFILKFWEFKLN